MKTFKSAFADYLSEQASWRDSKAQEYGDPRNDRAAAGLRELAEYVLSLPEYDERLLQLDAVTKYTEAGIGIFSPTVGYESLFDLGREISQFRFHGHVGDGLWDAADFLVWIVDRAQDEAVRQAGLS